MSIDTPQSLEAERSILGSMMIDPECLEWCRENVTEALFYRPVHQIIFNAMVAASGNVDTIIVSEALKNGGDLQRVGGRAYVSGLTVVVPAIENVRHYVDILREKYQARELYKLNAKILTWTSRPGAVLACDFIEGLKDDINRVERISGNGVVDTGLIYPALDARWRDIETGKKPVIPSGMHQLDEKLGGGFPRGHIVHIKGLKKRGKTGLALQILDQMANQKLKVFLISLEMRKDEVWPRVAACRLFRLGLIEDNFNYTQIQNNPKWASENEDLMQYVRYTEGWWIDDRETLSPNEIIRVINKHITEHQVDVVAIDHLNLVSFAQGHTQQDKEAFVERLRNLAKGKRIVLIALTQVQPKDNWSYYFKTLEHVAAIILHIDSDKEGKQISLEMETRFGPWFKGKYRMFGGVQCYDRPEGGGYHVPGSDFNERCRADSETVESSGASGGSVAAVTGPHRDTGGRATEPEGFDLDGAEDFF